LGAAPANGHCWLDPCDTSQSIPHPDPPSEQLPPAVRAFGFIPTFEYLRPGDVLLVSAIKPPLISRAIVKIQTRAGFDDAHAQWHHAAVYVGNHMVCEAQLWGVKTSSIFKYAAGKHKLRFRRPSGLDELSSCKLALSASLKLKYGYNWRSIFALLTQANTGWTHGSNKPRPLGYRATICSQLYADAYGVVTETTLDSRAESGVAPAHLSINRTLHDIPMKWQALKPPGAPTPTDEHAKAVASAAPTAPTAAARPDASKATPSEPKSPAS
jgi:hypothetical protein